MGNCVKYIAQLSLVVIKNPFQAKNLLNQPEISERFVISSAIVIGTWILNIFPIYVTETGIYHLCFQCDTAQSPKRKWHTNRLEQTRYTWLRVLGYIYNVKIPCGRVQKMRSKTLLCTGSSRYTKLPKQIQKPQNTSIFFLAFIGLCKQFFLLYSSYNLQIHILINDR